jgi:hypothetical protein
MPMTNTFYIAANIMFDLGTGETKEVFLLVNYEKDATFFKKANADAYKTFVESRAANKNANITWTVEPTNLRAPDLFVIKGVQYVA